MSKIKFLISSIIMASLMLTSCAEKPKEETSQPVIDSSVTEEISSIEETESLDESTEVITDEPNEEEPSEVVTEEPTEEQSEEPSEEISEEELSSEEEPVPNDGLTQETAFTAAEAINFVAQLENKVPTTDIYYVYGVVVSSTYKSKYNSYEITLAGENEAVFTLYSVGLDSSIEGDFSADNALTGYTVGCYGYLELFDTKYEMPYLNAKVSPTGAAYTPTIYFAEKPVE